ncbi:hypothetical protein ACH5RR_015560 [Cinchona calisaya]|uniref:Secreted protein n=1 Tax=Cinchona calisaya TaxID=153742 RepID=A0ABD2ZTJ3_9GENT
MAKLRLSPLAIAAILHGRCNSKSSSHNNHGLATASSSQRENNARKATTLSDVKDDEVASEMRPGVMLVQKRSGNSSDFTAMAPHSRVRVKFSALRHEISVSSQATFGKTTY